MDRISLLGIFLAKGNLHQIAKEILKQKTGYVSTVNLDFLARAYGHPPFHEYCDILRQSTIATADGMPLVWLSRFLGDPLKERVTGADLFPLLVKHINEKKGNICFIGGAPEEKKVIERVFKAHYPDLKTIAIIPYQIHTQGEELADAKTRDTLILEEIAKAKPDILFLGLGSPKQEIWYQRIKTRASLPITIGVGGALNFLIGTKKRAPLSWQRLGLEWLYRLIQEPSRLWQRYFWDAWTFFRLATPLMCTRFRSKTISHPHRSLFFLSKKHRVQLIKMPDYLSDANIFENAASCDTLILDCTHFRHASLQGLFHLANLYRNCNTIITCRMRKSTRFFLKLHRLFDLIEPTLSSSIENVVFQLKKRCQEPFLAISQDAGIVHIHLLGQIEGSVEKVLEMTQQKTVFCHLNYVSHITQNGFLFLATWKRALERSGGKLLLQNPSPSAISDFKNVGLQHWIEGEKR